MRTGMWREVGPKNLWEVSARGRGGGVAGGGRLVLKTGGRFQQEEGVWWEVGPNKNWWEVEFKIGGRWTLKSGGRWEVGPINRWELGG